MFRLKRRGDAVHSPGMSDLRPYDFLRAGGTVSMSEWALLDDEARDALAAAGDAVAEDRAELIATMLIAVFGEQVQEAQVAQDVSQVADTLAAQVGGKA